MLPFAQGNRWEYTTDGEEGVKYAVENVFEVVSFADGNANLSNYSIIETLGYEDATWLGNMLAVRRTYWNAKNNQLCDVREAMKSAERLAYSKREKVHTSVANEVMMRILMTDPTFNPDYTQKGHWNFFAYLQFGRKDDRITIDDNRAFSFEWKDMANCGKQGYKLLYNFIYERLFGDMGTLWSEEWAPGYHLEKYGAEYCNQAKIIFDVLEDETVTTQAGKFENCRHICYTASGFEGGMSYANGKKQYWFAEGVGIVKFMTDDWSGAHEAVYELTAYTGTGKGYFPVADGLVRRYEVLDISDGWHGGVEYTCDEDETGTVLFHNAWGTRDRQA